MIGCIISLVCLYCYVFSSHRLNCDQWFALAIAIVIEVVLEVIFGLAIVRFLDDLEELKERN